MSESTFRHSNARVPRLYKEAGKIVQKVREEGGSFKGLVYQSKHRSIKSLYALVAETLRHGSELDALLRQTQILVKEPRLDPWLARVLITELVWRERELSGPSVPLKIVQSYKSQLLSEEIGIPSQRLKPVSKATRPRFVRINTLKATEQEVLNYFRQEGWNILEKDQYDSTKNEEELYKNYLHRICSLSMDEFIRDIHIQNLLIFPGNMEFYNFEYYHDGSLLLQDKASCMSAHLLDAPPGSTVLDMCAAPGMKTTHVAAFLENKGNIYAIEKHQGRFESLCKVVEKAGATCVTPVLGNALHFTANDFPNVEYIVVDPTCSGSGMTNRKEIFNDEEDVSKSRLEKLSSFQCAILRHAMTNFPKTKRIVYSTCSLYPEENEAVVEEVLKTCPPNFKPVIPSKGTQWMKNGSSSYVYGEYGLYAKPNIDLTNGFFVIVFERTMNEYVSSKIITQDESTGINEVLDKKKKKREKRLQTQSRSNLFTETCTNPALEKMKKAMGNFYLLAQNEFVAPMESKKIIGEKKNELPAEQETSEHLPVELKQKKKKKGKLEAMKGGTVLPLDRTLKDPKADNFPLSEVNTAKRKHNRSFNRKQGIVKEACGELYLNPLERKDSYCYEEEIGVVKKLPEDSSSKRKKRDKPTVDEGGDLVNLSNRSCEFFKSKKRKNDHPSSME